MDASEKPPLTPYDVMRMVRKFLRSATYEYVEDEGTANWLIEKLTEQLGDNGA